MTVDGDTVTTQWGKIGTTGQSKTKSYDSPEAAEKDALKQKNAKLKKGYEEASSDNSGIAKTATVAHAKKAAAAPKKPIQEAIDPSSAPKAKLIAWCKAEGRTSTELEQALGRFPESDRAIASRDDCPSHILSELSHSSDKTTRSKVASNPKTLRDDFIRLGQLFTKEFLQNPLLDVLLLEDPGLLESLPHTLLTRIAKNEECPTPFLVWAASHSEEKVQLAVAMNHATPKEAIDVLRASSFEKVKNSLPIDYVIEGTPQQSLLKEIKSALGRINPNHASDAWEKKYLGLAQLRHLNAESALTIMDRVSDPHDSMRARIAEHCPNNLLDCLILDPIREVRTHVAKNPNLTAAQVSQLLLSPDKESLENLAANPAIGVVHLDQLSRNDDANIRAAVARNPMLSESTRDYLLADSSGSVRASLAWRANLTMSQQVRFLEAGKWTRELAYNPYTSSEILRKLLEDTTDKYTPLAVLGNPNTDPSVIEKNLKHGDNESLTAIARNPSLPDAMFHKLFSEQNHDINLSLSTNICCPKDILQNLAENGERGLRFRVARHPRCPEDLQIQLARKHPAYILDSLDVWRGLASNPALTNSLYLEIASEKLSIAIARAKDLLNLESSSWFKRNEKKATPETLEALASGDFLPPRIMDGNKLINARDEIAIILGAASNYASEPARIAKASTNPNWLARASIASNKNTPTNILAKLRNDNHPLVRALAQSNSVAPTNSAALTEELKSTSQTAELSSFLEAGEHWLEANIL